MKADDGEVVACGGVNAPSVLKAVWAIGAVEAACGLVSDVRDPIIVRLTKKLKKDWVPQGAPTFDVAAVRLNLPDLSCCLQRPRAGASPRSPGFVRG